MDLNANLVVTAVILKPNRRTVLFQKTKEWPPLVLVITEQNCHRPVIIKSQASSSILGLLWILPMLAHFCPPSSTLGEIVWGNVLSQHTWPGVCWFPWRAIQFLLWLFKDTYGWEWLIKRFFVSSSWISTLNHHSITQPMHVLLKVVQEVFFLYLVLFIFCETFHLEKGETQHKAEQPRQNYLACLSHASLCDYEIAV